MAAPLSLVAIFDDYVRRVEMLLKNGSCDCEEAFLQFIRHQEECRIQWNAAEMEVKRLSKEVTDLNHLHYQLEGQLTHGRRLIDQEIKKRKEAETERDNLERQLGMVRNLLFFGEEGKKLCNETKEKLAFLSNTTCRSRMSGDRHERLNTIDETGMDSTGSILSVDVSMSKSEDDLDVSALQTGKKWRRNEEPNEATAPKRRRSLNESVTMGTNRLVATTTVTMHRDGPVVARSRINAMDVDEKENGRENGRENWRPPRSGSRSRKTKAPPIPSTPESSDTDAPTPTNHKTPAQSAKGTEQIGWRMPALSTPSLVDLGGGFRPGKMRSHSFVTKTVIRPELCGPCGKRVSFGKIALRCSECRASCHPHCRDLMPLPCVPVGNTPTRNVPANAVLADFAPPTAPMIPALIVHCVNEIESRGLKEVGLYRVPGSEAEVRALREAFNRNKGCPHLASVEIPVLCGTVKDFLRGFREPIVTHHLWSSFVDAANKADPSDAQSAIFQAFSQLPPPNRDTLAFILLHLQRIAECVECKMPASNLAKVFGPTLVGYSLPNPSPSDIMSETAIQPLVVELLLRIGSDYYANFVNPSSEQISTPRSVTRQTSRHGFFGKATPNSKTLARNGKFF